MLVTRTGLSLLKLATLGCSLPIFQNDENTTVKLEEKNYNFTVEGNFTLQGFVAVGEEMGKYLNLSSDRLTEDNKY
eukprot:Awhi_evm1s6659